VNTSEIPNNTPDQVRQYLAAALELMEELEPAEDLRAPFFVKAVDLLSAKQIFMVQPQSPLAIGTMGLNAGRL
jgi:hypothetical protein